MTSCWNTILNALATRVDDFDFKVWLAPLAVQAGERSLNLCLQGASRYMLHRLEKKMGALIRSAAAQVFQCAPGEVRLSFTATGALTSMLASTQPGTQSTDLAGEREKVRIPSMPPDSQQAAARTAEPQHAPAQASMQQAQVHASMQAHALPPHALQEVAEVTAVAKGMDAVDTHDGRDADDASGASAARDAVKAAQSPRAGKRKAVQEPSLFTTAATQAPVPVTAAPEASAASEVQLHAQHQAQQQAQPTASDAQSAQSGQPGTAAGKKSRKAAKEPTPAILAEIMEKVAAQARSEAAQEAAHKAARQAAQADTPAEAAAAAQQPAEQPAEQHAAAPRKRMVHGGVYKRQTSARLAAAVRQAAEAAEAARTAESETAGTQSSAQSVAKPAAQSAAQPATRSAAGPAAQAETGKATASQAAQQPAQPAKPAAQSAAPAEEPAKPAKATASQAAPQPAQPAQPATSRAVSSATLLQSTAYTGPADGAFSLTTSSDARPRSSMEALYMGQAAADNGQQAWQTSWQAGTAFSSPVSSSPVSMMPMSAAIPSDAGPNAGSNTGSGPSITVSADGGTSTYTLRSQALVSSLPLNQAATLSGDALNRKQWRYTFADFVMGPCNAMAVSAAQDVCRPKSFVETLFVSSEPGLGKTHIVQSAVRQILEDRGPSAKVAYLTAEDFYARFRMGIRNDNLEDFASKVRALDFLLVDDVQFLCGKDRTQELLMSLVKQLQSKGSKVVFTSRFLSRDLNKLDSQLVSIIASGVQASMDAPDYAMRCEIVRRKSRAHGILLDEEVVGLLASHLEGDVRRIESCLQTLFLRMQVLGVSANPDLALEVLSKFGCVEKPDSPLPTFEDFLGCVSQCYGLTESQICSCIRRRNFVEARNVLFYLARKHTRLTLAQIGARVNKRHSTVIKGIASVEHTLNSQTSAGRQTAHLVELIEKNAGCPQPAAV